MAIPDNLSVYGAFFLSKFNLSLVFTNDLRFSTLTFVLFNLDIRLRHELTPTLSFVFQVQHSCYSNCDTSVSDQHTIQPQHSIFKFKVRFLQARDGRVLTSTIMSFAFLSSTFVLLKS